MKLDNAIAIKTALDREVKEILPKLIDKEILLEERWEAFEDLAYNKLITDIQSYGDGEIEILGDNLSVYDDLYCERHQTMTFLDVLERVEEDDEDKFDQAKIPEWKEKILEIASKGYVGFRYDW